MIRTLKFSLFVALISLAGCVMPLKPGKAYFSTPGVSGGVQQSENPQQETTQKYERTENGKVVERVETKIGAAQKDVAREMAAKLGALSGVVWVGLALCIFGVASLFWPPLKLIVGSATTSVAAIVTGVALMALPSIIVGHEILILCVGVGAVGIYWFAHRHGGLRATVEHLKGK